LALFSSDRDPDLAALSKDAKLLYVVIVTDPALNFAGVVLLRTGVWQEEASLDDDEFEVAFDELAKCQFTVVDRRTSELLVRSFIRNDKVAEQPNVLKGALSQAQQTRSRVLRRALAVELRRLPPKPPDRMGKNGRPIAYPDPHACAALLDPDGGPGPGIQNPSPNPSGNPSPNPSNGTLPGTLPGTLDRRVGGRGRGSGRGTSPVGGQVGGSRAPARENHPPHDDPTQTTRCPQHASLPPDADVPPCGHCAERRRTAERHLADNVLGELAARTHRRNAIDACRICDDHGMRELDDGSMTRCTHPALEAVS
jgi:hypothetical protein